jgi:multicomponent Na+:H+ antiporter subunit E
VSVRFLYHDPVLMQQFTSALPLSAALLALWVLLSGKLDAAHLSAGAAAALLIGVSTGRLWSLPPAIGPATRHPFQGLRWLRAMAYVPWLMWEIAISGVQVAFVVLHPRMPITPRLLRVRARLPHTLASLTLANSITLTPGTVTLDVEGDEFLVHALTPASARAVELGQSEGRVAALFSTADARQVGGEHP